MKKLLLCVLSLLLILCCAACADKPAEPNITPEKPAETETPEVVEPVEAALIEVNIHHLGILTSLDLTSEQTASLADQLLELLNNAVANDSMDTAPEGSLNPIQITKGQTALELVYNKAIELPLQEDGAPCTAQRLLYSIPYVGNDGGLLYLGEEIYEEAPVGKIFDQALQDAIYNAASDQVERVGFSADKQQVTIDRQDYAYKTGEDAAELSDMLLNRILYRGIAFYKNAYTGNISGLKLMSSNALIEAVTAVNDGKTTDNTLGEEAVAELNKYILAEFFLPQTIFAPVEQEEGYMVLMQLNELVTVELHFIVQEDIPLVNALYVIMAEQEEQ